MRKRINLIALAFVLLSTVLFQTQSGMAQSNVPASARSERPDMTIDAATRKEVIEAILKRLNESYVFPEVAKEMEKAINERVARGEYDKLTAGPDFAQTLTNHLRAVSRDKHLGVHFSPEVLPPMEPNREPTDADRERMRSMGARINYGFEKVERMSGNIGYLDLRGFFPAEFAGETVASAMNFLSNTDALIIDLRQNGGGDPAEVALICSYLFGPEPVHLNDLYWRADNSTHQWWTLPYVPGRRYQGKDVYVLTSSRTFSAAEEFTYNLKNLKRATIVGETTGGGANPGGGFRLSDHFAMFVPTGRAINPITKTNWEHTGVKPDVEVPADQALKTAQLDALKKIVAKTTDERRKNDLNRLIGDVEKELAELKKAQQSANQGNTTFRLKGYMEAHRIALAGSFNNWDMTKNICAREGEEWVCRKDLAPGKYFYKFVVDGDEWLTDPANPTREDDGNGNINSVLVVKGQ